MSYIPLTLPLVTPGRCGYSRTKVQDSKFLSAPIVRVHFRDYKHIGTVINILGLLQWKLLL